MSDGFFKKLGNVLKRDVSTVFSADSMKKVGKFVNTDVSDIVGDAKAFKILHQIEKRPDQINLYVELAQIYTSLEKKDKAADIYIGLAQKYMDQNNASQATFFLNMGLKTYPGHGPLNMLSADMDLRMGRYSDAPGKYRKAVMYFISKGDKMTGIYLLRKIKDMNRANQKDLLNLSGILIDQKMPGEALEILQSLKTDLKTKSNSLKDFEACLMMLHSLKKDDLSVLVELVETRIEMKEWERALILLKKLVGQDRKSIPFLKRLAFAYKNMKDMKNYIKTFRVIANLYSEQGNLVYRNIYYHKILKHLPNDVEALSVLNMDDKLRENIDTKIENTDSKIKMMDN